MAKKSKATGSDSERLVKRLREAQAKLRSHSLRTANAADALERVLRDVVARIGHADGATARTTTARTARRTTTRTPSTRAKPRAPRTSNGGTGTSA